MFFFNFDGLAVFAEYGKQYEKRISITIWFIGKTFFILMNFPLVSISNSLFHLRDDMRACKQTENVRREKKVRNMCTMTTFSHVQIIFLYSSGT
jgi:hypothetical protein